MDYQIATNIRTLRELADKGYRFVAIINPDEWLVGKKEKVSEELPPFVVSEELSTTGTATTSSVTELESPKHGPRTDKKSVK